jgi:hypothetical protein
MKYFVFASLLFLVSCQQAFYYAELSYESFSVTRFEEAVLILRNVANVNDIALPSVEITASCKEDGYNALETELSSVVNFSIGETKDVTLRLSDGWPYFTNNTVRCDFSGDSPAVAEVYFRRK